MRARVWHATDQVTTPQGTLCKRPMWSQPKVDNANPTCKRCLRHIAKRLGSK